MINIDVTILIQFLNFLILMAVLNYLLFRPLRAIMQQRKETIEGSNQTAKDLEGAIEEKMTRYQDQLQEAKLKGSQERAAMRPARKRPAFLVLPMLLLQPMSRAFVTGSALKPRPPASSSKAKPRRSPAR